MLESISWTSRLDEVSENFKSIPSSSVVHLELASMASVAFVKNVMEKVCWFILTVLSQKQNTCLI